MPRHINDFGNASLKGQSTLKITENNSTKTLTKGGESFGHCSVSAGCVSEPRPQGAVLPLFLLADIDGAVQGTDSKNDSAAVDGAADGVVDADAVPPVG